MQGEPGRSEFTKLISVPGLVAVAILGVAIVAMAHFFGPGNFIREVATEMVASFGSTVLVLAIFGLLLRSRLEWLLRGAPGGEALERSVERLADVMQSPGAQDLKAQEAGSEAKLDQVGEDVRSLAEHDVPALREEVAELRAMLAALQRERSD